MAATIPTYVPDTLPAGVDWQWTWSSPDFPPADVSALKFYFSGAASFSITATAGSADFSVSVANTTTADYTAGTYKWTAIATVSGIDYPADSGVMVITPSPKATGDQRSHAGIGPRLLRDRRRGLALDSQDLDGRAAEDARHLPRAGRAGAERRRAPSLRGALCPPVRERSRSPTR